MVRKVIRFGTGGDTIWYALEMRVLEGGWQTITKWRPVIFLELSADKQRILERMSSVNYSSFIYEDHRIRKYERDCHTDNVIFLPDERIGEVRTALASKGQSG